MTLTAMFSVSLSPTYELSAVMMMTGGTVGPAGVFVLMVLGPVSARFPLSFLIVHNKRTAIVQKRDDHNAILTDFTVNSSF